MLLSTRYRLLRAITVLTCLVAMLIFSLQISPAEAYVESGCTCKFASVDYSDGACLNGQTCVCNFSETGCICKWITSGCGN